MNLAESDTFKEELEKNTKKKKIIILSIILCVILIILLVAMIVYIQHKDSITEKFFIDGKQISKPNNLYIDVEGSIYIDVVQFAKLIESSTNTVTKYNFQKGHYGLYDEDEKSCLIDNGFETLALSSDNKYYTKYIDKDIPSESTIAEIEVKIKSEYGYYEKFLMDKPIIYMNNAIYVPLDNISEMFNVKIEWEQYRKRIYSFENMLASTTQLVKKIGANQVIDGYYENLKAILYGYIVLQDSSETYYGVYSLTDGSEILSSKYKDIKFVQNAKEFYVTTDNDTMGLVSADGNTIIKASEYKNISLLDSDSNLYLVEKNSEYGVINKSGKTIIYPEYDGIGYDVSQYTLESIENNNLLAEKFIPVEKNKKFGLFNADGEQVLNTSFDAFGYVSASTTKKAGEEESILMIPKSEGINGIIVNQGDLYGIFDIDKQELVLPCSYSKIFAVRKAGQINYYIEFAGEQFQLKDYLKTNGLARNYDIIEENDNENNEERDDKSTEEKNEIENTNVNEVEEDKVENENKSVEEEV